MTVRIMHDNNELIDQHYCFWAVLCLLIKYSTTISFSTTYRTLNLSPKEISQKSSWARSPYWCMEFSTIQFRVHLEFLYEKKFFLLPIPVNKEWRNGDNTEISKWIKIEKGKYGRYTAVSHTIVGAPYPKDRKDILVRHWFCSLEELSFSALAVACGLLQLCPFHSPCLAESETCLGDTLSLGGTGCAQAPPRLRKWGSERALQSLLPPSRIISSL